eukprot:1894937-Rhodomonas_salina.1
MADQREVQVLSATNRDKLGTDISTEAKCLVIPCVTARTGMSLRAWYARPGTDVASGATRDLRTQCAGSWSVTYAPTRILMPMQLNTWYKSRSTDAAHGG